MRTGSSYLSHAGVILCGALVVSNGCTDPMTTRDPNRLETPGTHRSALPEGTRDLLAWDGITVGTGIPEDDPDPDETPGYSCKYYDHYAPPSCTATGRISGSLGQTLALPSRQAPWVKPS